MLCWAICDPVSTITDSMDGIRRQMRRRKWLCGRRYRSREETNDQLDWRKGAPSLELCWWLLSWSFTNRLFRWDVAASSSWLSWFPMPPPSLIIVEANTWNYLLTVRSHLEVTNILGGATIPISQNRESQADSSWQLPLSHPSQRLKVWLGPSTLSFIDILSFISKYQWTNNPKCLGTCFYKTLESRHHPLNTQEQWI